MGDELHNYLQLLEEKEKRACEKSLAQFVKSSWHLVEPGTPLVWNWHLDVICGYLEALAENKITRLIINVPPGTLKSSVVSVCYHAFRWIKHPENRFLGITNEQGLALRDALKAKVIIESEWYQSKWPIKFDPSQNEKILYQNVKRGFRQSVGIKAGFTGKKADTITIDDPNDSTQAESEAHRKAVNDTYDLKIVHRLNDPQESHIVLISQRLHTLDLTGHLLTKVKSNWINLVIPMEYEGKPSYDPVADIGRPDLADPRTELKQLLFPSRFNQQVVESLKEDLGSYGTAGQLQQSPSPREGGIVKIKWFRRYDTPPKRDPSFTLRLSLDTANKDKQINDPTVAGVWLSNPAGHYLLDVVRERLLYPDLKRTVLGLLDKWKPDECLIEDKASGQQLIQDLNNETIYNIIPIEPTGEGDKVVRMSNASPAIEAGNVWLPNRAEWLFTYEQEMKNFPKAPHDDQVDMTSQFLNRVKRSRGIFVG